MSRVFFNVLDNYIDGKEFVSLSEAEVKSMVGPIGLAKKILRLIPEVSRVEAQLSEVLCLTCTLNTHTYANTCKPAQIVNPPCTLRVIK